MGKCEYWLEGVIHKEDKEVTKLRKEVATLSSELNNLKTHLV